MQLYRAPKIIIVRAENYFQLFGSKANNYRYNISSKMYIKYA